MNLLFPILLVLSLQRKKTVRMKKILMSLHETAQYIIIIIISVLSAIYMIIIGKKH